MPKPIPMSRRRWIAAWAVLCAGGLAATAGLNSSAPRDPLPEETVSAECAEQIADIEQQLAKAEQEGKEDGVLAFSRVHDASDDCDDELRKHFGGDR
ncbi:hypothetical protein [Streptomyces sp. NPDC057302]|uniref:hypothetical protein n=1 Tax=Streptomyces sp. NPDC057302 TaxID=3346094 RepID=UPI00362B4759